MGDLPSGWVWLLTYASAEPVADLTPLLDRLDLDGALCPEHRAALRALLVERPDPRPFGKPSE